MEALSLCRESFRRPMLRIVALPSASYRTGHMFLYLLLYFVFLGKSEVSRRPFVAELEVRDSACGARGLLALPRGRDADIRHG